MKESDLAEFWALFSLAHPTLQGPQLLSETPLWDEAGTWSPSISQAAGMRDTRLPLQGLDPGAGLLGHARM